MQHTYKLIKISKLFIKIQYVPYNNNVKDKPLKSNPIFTSLARRRWLYNIIISYYYIIVVCDLLFSDENVRTGIRFYRFDERTCSARRQNVTCYIYTYLLQLVRYCLFRNTCAGSGKKKKRDDSTFVYVFARVYEIRLLFVNPKRNNTTRAVVRVVWQSVPLLVRYHVCTRPFGCRFLCTLKCISDGRSTVIMDS